MTIYLLKEYTKLLILFFLKMHITKLFSNSSKISIVFGLNLSFFLCRIFLFLCEHTVYSQSAH